MALGVQHLGTFGPLRCGEMYALDRLLREARVLEIIRHITKDNPKRLRQPSEGKLWYLSICLCLCCLFVWKIHAAIISICKIEILIPFFQGTVNDS